MELNLGFRMVDSKGKDMKTSEEWNKKYENDTGRTIRDADGWDRKSFDYSWNKEMITWDEFLSRVMQSTLI